MKLKTENKLLTNFSVASLTNIVLLLLTFFLLFGTQPPVRAHKVETGEAQSEQDAAQTPAAGPVRQRPLMSRSEAESAGTVVPKLQSMEDPVVGKNPVAVPLKKSSPRLVQKGSKERAVNRGSATKGKKSGGGRQRK